jgi:signal transduction histidine kinase
MRWPIQFQLLLPNLSVVVLAIVLASAASAYFGAARARRIQEENLERVVATVAELKFPQSPPVLRLMKGLSGTDFVLLDRDGSVEAATLPLDDEDSNHLRGIRGVGDESDWAARPAISLGGRAYLTRRVAVPARDPSSPAGSLVVLYPEDRRSAMMRQAAYPALAAGGLAVVAVVLVTSVLAHRFVRPIRLLVERTAAIARGEFQPVAVSARDDEIRDLALSINRMAEQLGQYEGQVRRHEQLRTLGQLGAGMAHQLRNAATGGRMAIELHQRECAARQPDESLDVALRQLRLMESYLQRFLELGRDRPIVEETISLASVVADALALVRPMCEHVGIDLELQQPAEPLWIRGDAEALRQLAVNLVLNAVEASGQQRRSAKIIVAVERVDDGLAALHVRDSGPGPAADVAERLFEPFVSGKPESTGLGLYVARQVAEAHHGSIFWQRVDNETRFTVELPLVSQTPLANPSSCPTC